MGLWFRGCLVVRLRPRPLFRNPTLKHSDGILKNDASPHKTGKAAASFQGGLHFSGHSGSFRWQQSQRIRSNSDDSLEPVITTLTNDLMNYRLLVGTSRHYAPSQRFWMAFLWCRKINGCGCSACVASGSSGSPEEIQMEFAEIIMQSNASVSPDAFSDRSVPKIIRQAILEKANRT